VENVEDYAVSMLNPNLIETALDIFKKSGFVVVTGVLKLHEYMNVLNECRQIEKQIVGPFKKGNRGHGRYSIGNASSHAAIHLAGFAKHLVGSGMLKLLPLLKRIFGPHDSPEADASTPSFHVVSAGGDFVIAGVDEYQGLHSDKQFKKDRGRMPPPVVSMNFAVEDIGEENGPMRILPGQLTHTECHKLEFEAESSKLSRLCPLSAGTVVIRDIRVLHGGTPNRSASTRFLPAVLLAAEGINKRYYNDGPKKLPQDVFDLLPEQVKPYCEFLVGDIKASDVTWTAR
jgi:hypothetical protein